MYTILICDDERDIVSALKIYLSTEDYTLFEAYTGREALDIVRKHEIHLILMDIMMPEMDGVTATAKLREEYNIPIILLTAKSEDTDKVLGPERGGRTTTLPNPLTPSRSWPGSAASCGATPPWGAWSRSPASWSSAASSWTTRPSR